MLDDAKVYNIKDYKRKKRIEPPKDPRQIICLHCQTDTFSVVWFEGKFKTICSLCTKITELKI